MKHLILLGCLWSLSLMPVNRVVSAEPLKPPPFVLVIHGGVGVLSKKEMTPEKEAAYREKLAEALRAGCAVLKADGTSLDAVVAAIKILEDSPLFNAGKGAALNRDGVAELDASLMDGATRKAGAVAAVKRIKNPIEAARLVMDKTPHVLLAGAGADAFAQQQGLMLMPPEYFIIEERQKQLEEIKREEKSKKQAGVAHSHVADRVGTVGAVALDKHGNLAAGTSTGGLANKRPGRVGDSPLIGAGTYANNATCAVSGTGQGELFIRLVAAYDIAALMDYKKVSLTEAADAVVMKKLVAMNAESGVIAIDRQGNIAMPFNTEGMYRGSIREDGQPNIAIYEK
jgi:beta-aspartyl-peptidase (threonine type)